MRTLREFATLLEQGGYTEGDPHQTPHTFGFWKGRKVLVELLVLVPSSDRDERDFYTQVSTRPRTLSPLFLWMKPRDNQSIPPTRRPLGAARWLPAVDHVFDITCQPPGLFELSLDDSTAVTLSSLVSTSVGAFPSGEVIIRRSGWLPGYPGLIPLLDAAVALADRLDATAAFCRWSR
jgi:hypothetical protein